MRPVPISLPADLWCVPAYLRYVQRRLTAARLAAAERQLGVRLPASLVACLREQNGGYLRRTHPRFHFDCLWGIGATWPSLANNSFDEWIASSRECGAWVPAQCERLVPFGGDGHTYFCLDYRKSGPRDEPSVAFVDLECERSSRVAASFANFLAALRDESLHGVLVIDDDGMSLAEAAARLGRVLRRPVESVGDFAHGYDQYRAKLGTEKDPQWAWLSPNEVTRGFRRLERPKGGTVIERLPVTGPRYSRLPRHAILVSATEDVSERVEAACRAAFTSVRVASGRR